MADFKLTLTRPGIALNFETGSIKEAIGLLETEGTQISEIFGFVVGQPATEVEGPATTDAEPAKESKRRGRPPKAATEPAPEVIAPDPMPLPVTVAAPPIAPPADLTIPTDGSIPSFLNRAAAPPALPTLPTLPKPPAAVAPPPVGVLGPKVVAALERHKAAEPADEGKKLADWLAAAGLTLKGASYDDACRAVLMISDDKLTASGILAPLGIS